MLSHGGVPSIGVLCDGHADGSYSGLEDEEEGDDRGL